jgi:hypothetical protein
MKRRLPNTRHDFQTFERRQARSKDGSEAKASCDSLHLMKHRLAVAELAANEDLKAGNAFAFQNLIQMVAVTF